MKNESRAASGVAVQHAAEVFELALPYREDARAFSAVQKLHFPANITGQGSLEPTEHTAQCMIITANRGLAFAFECSMFDFHFSTWGYDIEATASGCRVTEWTEDLRPESALEFSARKSGIDDRAERNRQTISGTLERLAEADFSDPVLVRAAFRAPEHVAVKRTCCFQIINWKCKMKQWQCHE